MSGQVVSFTGYTPPARFDSIPWTTVQVQEATTSAGSWLIIDAISLSPVDPDPAVPSARSFTTENGSAPNLWYRVVFLDGTGDYTEPTLPLQNLTPTVGTWTYDPTTVDTNEVYAVRLEVGDTDPQAWLMSNEEIQHAINNERNFWAAAARCAEMISRLFLRKIDVRLGRSLTVTYTLAAKQYMDMARTLRIKAMGSVVPYVGGMTVNDKLTIGGDSSLVQPAFTKSQMENPWVGGYDNDASPPLGSEETEGFEFE